MLPLTSSRLNSMSARPDLWQGDLDTVGKIRRAGQVRGLDTIDLNYPGHVQDYTPAQIRTALQDSGLSLCAVNLRYDGTFVNGGFTNPDAKLRREAIDLTRRAGEYALEMEANQIIIWPSEDGYDYPFQVDYQALWDATVGALRELADALPELSIAVEYKPIDPRRFYIVGDMNSTLLALAEADRPNLGVVLDFAHSLMARENPAHAAQRALARRQLVGLHLNDGYGQADDGLVIGSIHPLQTLELIYYLQQYGYDRHIYFDTFPIREDPVAEAELNIARLKLFWEAAAGLDRAALADMQAQQDALAVLDLLKQKGLTAL